MRTTHKPTTRHSAPTGPTGPTTNRSAEANNNSKQQSQPRQSNIESSQKTFKYIEKRLAFKHHNEETIKNLFNHPNVIGQTSAKCVKVIIWEKPEGWSTIFLDNKSDMDTVSIQGQVYDLETYRIQLKKCGHCQKWSHSAYTCKLAYSLKYRKCSRCGGNHQNNNCNKKVCCANCEGNHYSHDNSCPDKIIALKKWNEKSQTIEVKKTINIEIKSKINQIQKQTHNAINQVKKTFAEVTATNQKKQANQQAQWISVQQLEGILIEVLNNRSCMTDPGQVSLIVKQAIKNANNSNNTVHMTSPDRATLSTKTSNKDSNVDVNEQQSPPQSQMSKIRRGVNPARLFSPSPRKNKPSPVKTKGSNKL